MALSRRATIGLATGTAVLVTAAGVWVAFGIGGSPSGQALPAVTDPATTAVTTTPTTTVAPTTTIAPTTVATTTRPRTNAPVAPVKAMPPPVKPPASVPVPPPPHTTPAPGCTPTKTGTAAAHADVRAALRSAAGTQYWTSAVQNPPLVNQNPPPAGGGPDPSPALGPRAVITVPAALMEAIAWQESGWQSNIASCDGGHGTMQLMSATATWMNQRFGTHYDYTTLAGNAAIGGEYIEWLIGYFGENSFDHHYDITDPDLVVAVLDAYNGGAASVQFAAGHTVVSHYAATVEALMSQQPWNG